MNHETSRAEHLHEFLARHDEACPACRYNLRGAIGNRCPECGVELELGVRTGALTARRGLLMLVFVWVLASGALGAWREGREIHAAWTSRPQILLGGPYLSMTPPSSPSSPSSQPLTGLFTVPPNVVTGANGQTILRWQAPPVAGPSAVPWRSWIEGGTWALLAVAGAAGTALLARYRRRRVPRLLPRALSAMAWTSFAAYMALTLAAAV